MRPYLVGVFNEFGFPVDSKLILVVTGVSFLLGAIFNLILLRRIGKRKLSLISQGICTVAILIIGVYCSFFDKSNRDEILVWIPVICMNVVYFFSGLSIVLLPWQLLSEVFPLKGRGAAGGISAAWSYFTCFVLTKSYLYLERWFHLNGVMFIYGIISVIGFLYFCAHLPETEGKSLEQIETYFTKNHSRKEKFLKPRMKN